MINDPVGCHGPEVLSILHCCADGHLRPIERVQRSRDGKLRGAAPNYQLVDQSALRSSAVDASMR